LATRFIVTASKPSASAIRSAAAVICSRRSRGRRSFGSGRSQMRSLAVSCMFVPDTTILLVRRTKKKRRRNLKERSHASKDRSTTARARAPVARDAPAFRRGPSEPELGRSTTVHPQPRSGAVPDGASPGAEGSKRASRQTATDPGGLAELDCGIVRRAARARMKAAIMHEFGGIPRYEDFPDPVAEDGEVVVEVRPSPYKAQTRTAHTRRH